MKKKKIDNNSKFLFMMSGFFVLLFAMIFASTELGKVTYSTACNGTALENNKYCCTVDSAWKTLQDNMSEGEATYACNTMFSAGFKNGYYYVDCEVQEDEEHVGKYVLSAYMYSGCTDMTDGNPSCRFASDLYQDDVVVGETSTTNISPVVYSNSKKDDYNFSAYGSPLFSYNNNTVSFTGTNAPGIYKYTMTYTNISDNSIKCSTTVQVTVTAGNTNPGTTPSEPEFTCPTGYDDNPNATMESECYLLTDPGYYVKTDFGQQEICPKGKYCVGGIKIYAGHTGGSVDCGRGYTTIDEGSARSRDCVMDCSGTKGAVDDKNRQPFTFTFYDIVTGDVARGACCAQNNGRLVNGDNCYVCRDGYRWSTDYSCCIKASECTSDNCVNYCDNSANGKYDNPTAEQVAKEQCGIGNYGIDQNASTGCFTYKCTCVAERNEYKTEALRDAAVLKANCKNGVNKWKAANGCYKYACKDAPEDPSSGSSSSSSSSSSKPSSGSSSKPSSSSVKPSSKPSDITVNPPTGPGLIIIVSILSVIMVAYSVWYFKKNQE